MTADERRAIEQDCARLIALYANLNDEARWDEVAALYADDGVMVRPTAPDAPTQGVIDSMYAAGRALVMGDRAAAVHILSAPFYQPGGEALLAKLAALPLIPQVNIATTQAEAAYLRMMRDGYSRPGGVRN